MILIDELKKIKFNSILEIGCSNNGNIKIIDNLFPDAIVKGIDKSPMTQDQYGLAQKIPYTRKSFDVIYSGATLIYINEKEGIRKAIKEIRRVGKKYAFFQELNTKNWLVRLWFRIFKGYIMWDYQELLKGLDYKMEKKTDKKSLVWRTFGYFITIKL